MVSGDDASEIAESVFFRTWRLPDGIVRTSVKPGVVIDVEAARANTRTVQQLCGARRRPLLVDLKYADKVTDEAREHFAIKDRETTVNSIALLIHSPLHRTIGNLYMKINKPTVPTRLFTSEDKATSWLKEYLH